MNTMREPTHTAPKPAPRAPAAEPRDETALLAALRAGDEAAFLELVERLHAGLIRLATVYVRTREVAEEVVQDSWVAVLKGLARFEGRSSLRTWISHIVANQAKTRGVREARSIPFSAFQDAVGRELEDETAAVDPARFHSSTSVASGALEGHWRDAPANWSSQTPEQAFANAETRSFLEARLEELPAAQRIVVTLRDVDGWTSEEVCNALGLRETNQRVLLHRGRSRLRAALEKHFAEEPTPCSAKPQRPTSWARS